MPLYTVLWEIEIDADSPREAAEYALGRHRDPDSTANYFEVVDNTTGKVTPIDLMLDTPEGE